MSLNEQTLEVVSKNSQPSLSACRRLIWHRDVQGMEQIMPETPPSEPSEDDNRRKSRCFACNCHKVVLLAAHSLGLGLANQMNLDLTTLSGLELRGQLHWLLHVASVDPLTSSCTGISVRRAGPAHDSRSSSNVVR